MTESATPPKPFEPPDPQHATWPQPFEPDRDLAELAIVNTSPSIVMPGASVADPLTKKQAQDMRRAIVEDDYSQRMLAVLGDDLTRIYRHADGATLYFKQAGRVADQGAKLTVLGGMDEKLAALRIVALGRERSWKTIKFTGSGSFVELAMREALKQRLTVIASDARQAIILAKLMAERQGGMDTFAGPALLTAGTVSADANIPAILAELDGIAMKPEPIAPHPAKPASPVATPPATLAMPGAPPAPRVGTLPLFLNLRERLQDRRDQRPPTNPTQAPAAAPKKPRPV